MVLDWQGDALLRRIEAACIDAVDETTGAAAEVARGLVHVDTGLLQSRIGTVPAVARGDEIVGAMGVPDDPGYAIPQEYLPGPRGKAYIRPAADQEFPTLGERIAKRLGQ
jgi:hypothetical protein